MNQGALRKYLVVAEAMIRMLLFVHSLSQNTYRYYLPHQASLLGVALMSYRYDCQELVSHRVMEDYDFYLPTSYPISCLLAYVAGLIAFFLDFYSSHPIHSST